MSKKRREKKRAKRLEARKKLVEDLAKSDDLSSAQKQAMLDIQKTSEQIDDVVDAQVDKEEDDAFFDAASVFSSEGAGPTEAPTPKKPPTPQAPAASTSATNIPYTKQLADKASNFSPFFGNIFGRGTSAKTGPSDEEKETRSGIVKINNQLILTKKIIESNEVELRELAKTDEGVRKILEATHSDQAAAIEKVQNAILRGDEVSAADAKLLIENLKDVTHEINNTKVALSTSFTDIASHFSDLIENEALDRDDRRDMIKELVKISSSSEIQAGLSAEQNLAASELKKMSAEGINFTEAQNKDIHDMLKILTMDSDTNVKLRGTLKELNSKIESSVLTEEELAEQLAKKDDKGKSLEENAGAQGISSLAKTAKSGIVDFLLGQVGLGGLGLGELGIGDIVGGAKAIPGLLGKAGGFLGKAGRFAGKAALPVAAAMTAFDFYKGYTNADEISGQKEGQHASFGQKIQAGGASVLSGLSFGLLGSDKDMYKHITDGIQFLFGEEGVLTKAGKFLGKIFDITPIGYVWNSLKAIEEAFMGLFSGDEALLPKIGTFLKKIFEITPIGYVMAHMDSIKKGISTLFGPDSIITRMANFFMDAPKLFADGLASILGNPSQIIDKLGQGAQALMDFIFGADGLFSLKTVKSVLKAGASTALPSFVVDKIFGTDDDGGGGQVVKGAAAPVSHGSNAAIQAAAFSPGASGFDAAMTDEKVQRGQSAATLAAAQSKPAPTVVIHPSPAANSPDRSAHIDDTKLAVMSAGLSGI